MTTQTQRARQDYDILSKPQRKWPVLEATALTVIFALALALRYWFVFLAPHINIASVSDASEFLRNAEAMLNLRSLPTTFLPEAWQALTSGTATPEQLAQLKQQLSPLQGLYISGPIIPIFFAATYVMAFTQFSFANCTPPLVGNIILSALTCVFFALTAGYAFDKKTGFLAGLLCAFYPALIINSGRLYCETLAAFLLSVVCFFTVRGFSKELSVKDTVLSAFLNGIFAAFLQFSRSITVFVSLALLPIVLFQQGLRKGLLALPLFLFGFALIALPWLGLQQLTFGSAGLVVDRVGNYNFFMGNHVDGAGFVSFPYEDGAGIEKRPLTQLAKEAVSRSPSRWLHLMLQDKPLRLFKMPWNDFRMPLGPIDFRWQAIIHQILLLLAAIAVPLAFVTSGGATAQGGNRQPLLRPTNAVTPAKIFLLSIVALHLAYLFFITVPRYNLTVVPIVLIFAAAGVTGLVGLVLQRGGAATAVGIVLSAVLLFAISNIPLAAFVQLLGARQVVLALTLQCTLKFFALSSLAFCLWQSVSTFSAEAKRTQSIAPSRAGMFIGRFAVGTMFLVAVATLVVPARANGRWDEWAAPLTAGRTAEQHLVLPARIVLDLAEEARTAYLLVDTDDAQSAQSLRIKVNGHTLDAPVVAGNSLVDQQDFGMYINLPGGGFMREGERIFDCLTAPSGISNADLRQWFFVPVPTQVLSGQKDVVVNIANAREEEDTAPVVYGNYSSKRGKSVIPGIDKYSWEKTFFGVENQRGFCDTRYDTKLADDSSVPQTKDMSGTLGLQSGRYNVRLLVDRADRTKLISVPQLVETTPVGDARLSKSLPPFAITTTAMPFFDDTDYWFVRVRGEARRVSGAGDVSMSVKASDGNNFYQSPWTGTLPVGQSWRKFDSAVPVAPGKLKDMQPTAITCTMTAKDLGVAADTEFKNVQMEIWHLPNNPLTPGYEVF
jgi:hypothetical protein